LNGTLGIIYNKNYPKTGIYPLENNTDGGMTLSMPMLSSMPAKKKMRKNVQFI
jgi:hypothetical protein